MSLQGVSDARGDAVGTLRFLLGRGARFRGSFALHDAAGKGNLEVIAALAHEVGPDVDEMSAAKAVGEALRGLWGDDGDQNGTSLHWAVEARRMGSVRWLLERGTDASRRDAKGRDLPERSELLRKPPNRVWGELVEGLERRGLEV